MTQTSLIFVTHPGMISLNTVNRETIASFLVVIRTSTSFSSHREHNSQSSDTFSYNLNGLQCDVALKY